MPQFTFQSPEGKIVTLEGEAPPPKEIVDQAFSKLASSTPEQSMPAQRDPTRGGIGNTVTREGAKQIAAQRVYDRNKAAGIGNDLMKFDTPNAEGEYLHTVGTGPVGQAIATAKGLVGGFTAGLSDATLGLTSSAIQKGGKALDLPENVLKSVDVNEIAKQNPTTSLVAPLVGGLGPIRNVGAKALEQGTKLAKAGKSALAAGTQGGVYSGSQVIGKEGLDANPAEVAKESAKGFATTAPFGLVLPAAASVLEGLSRLPKSSNGILARLTDFTPSQRNEIRALNAGDFEKVLPEVKALKQGEGATPTIAAMDELLKQNAKTFQAPVKNSNPALLAPDVVEKQLRTDLIGRLPTPVLNAEVEKLKTLVQDTTPENLLSNEAYLNSSTHSYYTKRNPELSADSVIAMEALRDIYSLKIRNALRDQGIDPQLYSRYGKVRTLRNQIDARYEEAKQAANEARGYGPLENAGSEASKAQNAGSAAVKGAKGSIKNALTNDKEKFDSLVEEMFSKVKTGSPSASSSASPTPSGRPPQNGIRVGPQNVQFPASKIEKELRLRKAIEQSQANMPRTRQELPTTSGQQDPELTRTIYTLPSAKAPASRPPSTNMNAIGGQQTAVREAQAQQAAIKRIQDEERLRKAIEQSRIGHF